MLVKGAFANNVAGVTRRRSVDGPSAAGGSVGLNVTPSGRPEQDVIHRVGAGSIPLV